ncbi:MULTISPECIES: GNAT family N-acetyltransferase [unclassified Shewanella]|uniref:GNAT family N-acetyltransferase n=1 Tax=unclassified Shewanella TaxID=196818 RepID=UPI0021D98900|nr:MULTISPECIES: GNAT family N-acetyltransferase [unclassified Shewanella]MCU8003515.1 acetyltransferase [Shewanella sp. SM96]MCU8061790.1 acetyltransferase [Shewanella sp. SM55]MCU8088158.1 acetyltransferase [Shewanella sp. SM21]
MASQFSNHCLTQLSAISSINGFQFRALDLTQDIPTLQSWFNQDYAKFWGMQGLNLDAIKNLLATTEHKFALMGEWQGKSLFMVELYDPAHDEVGKHYRVAPGDCGMHLIIAPPDGSPINGLSFKVMDAIAQLVLEKLAFNRLVVEPDQLNSKIHRLNSRVGIRYEKAIQLSTKAAFLGFCTAADRQLASSTPSSMRLAQTTSALPSTLAAPVTSPMTLSTL